MDEDASAQPSSGGSAIPEKVSRRAVVSIHGVGEHVPGAMARAISAQLVRCGRGYRGFDEAPLEISVTAEGLDIPADLPGPSGVARLARGFQSVFRAESSSRGAVSRTPVDIEYSSTSLLNGRDYRAVYATTKCTLTREGDDLHPGELDVFELHWSDLSHEGRGVPALARTILQLLVHLASLGRTSAATALPEARGGSPDALWTSFYRLNATSYWLLSTPILIGNMLLAMIGLLAVPAMLARPETVVPYVPPVQQAAGLAPYAALLLGISVAVVAGRLALSVSADAGPSRAAFGLILPSLLVSAAAAAIGFCAFAGPNSTGLELRPILLAAIEGPFLLLLGETAMRDYDRSRPGALLVWRLMACGLAVTACGLAAVLAAAGPADPGADPSSSLVLWLGCGANAMFLALSVLWALLYLSNLLMLALGVLLQLRTLLMRGDGRSADLRRAVATCFLSASLPTCLLLAALLTFWSMLIHLYTPMMPDIPFHPWPQAVFGTAETTGEFMRSMVEGSAGGLFLPYALLMAVAAIVAAWSFLPSIALEIIPGDDGPPDRAHRASLNLGGWLDGAFPAIAIAGVLAVLAQFVVLPISTGSLIALHSGVAPTGWLGRLGASHISFYAWTGILVSATTVSFLAATKLLFGRVFAFLKKLQVVIDTALDVDNWLRQRPVGSTPRLRIFARLESLLAHLAASGVYDRVVVVAHSQGTVVAADFFRFVHAKKGRSRLGALPPVHMFSAGTPLRQLYALRFPILYHWVRRSGSNKEGTGPIPAECGFSRWVNAYGSGDYVGRYLWASDAGEDRWTPGEMPPLGARGTAEFCVGCAAHTHYFDEGNARVGSAVDKFVWLPDGTTSAATS